MPKPATQPQTGDFQVIIVEYEAGHIPRWACRCQMPHGNMITYGQTKEEALAAMREHCLMMPIISVSVATISFP